MSFNNVDYRTIDNRPNVLLVCVDQWPGLLCEEAGNTNIMTPFLNSLSKSGIRYSEAYSCTPSCIPARREIMTGVSAKIHGDRIFNETLEMPSDQATLAETFRNAGYQTNAVGKMHVYPQRDRVGFEEIILCEEGRKHLDNLKDDYELFLDDEGYAGQAYMHGSGNNRYNARPWHLPEQCHPTYWTTKNICRTIQRRDPKRPAFWYVSYITPHPPVTPPKDYWDIYMNQLIDSPVYGDWSADPEKLPRVSWSLMREALNEKQIGIARKAFYAQCSYIDQMLSTVIGTLREEELLDNTIIMFTCDHGDMLGHHNMFAKGVFYEYSSKIHMILSVPDRVRKIDYNTVDDRFAEHKDIMPTLLDLCSIDIPAGVEGYSLVSTKKREYVYGEHYEDVRSTRMIRKGDFKLIYYAAGNVFQFFNIKDDPFERCDLYKAYRESDVFTEMKTLLIDNLYGSDTNWIHGSTLVGLPSEKNEYHRDRGLLAQRGLR